MEEELFPRGGAERIQKKLEQPETKETKKSRKRANSKDFLFGSKEVKPKKSKKTRDSSKSSIVASSSLPLGGGAVLQPTQSASTKKPAFIEAISFQKLAKGTKLIGVVRDVASEYAVVSLPSMLTGFVRRDAKSDIPVNKVLSIGQFLPVVVVKATSESVKIKNGNSSQMKRRIELSVSPSLLNTGLSPDMLHEDMNIRGKIKSVEDHGCIIDLSVNGLGGSSCFLKFENIKGEYCIVDEDEDGNEQMEDQFKLNKGRIFDFTIKSLPDKTKKDTSTIIQVELESIKSRSNRLINPAQHLASNHNIRTLCPGMLVKTDVEHFARNGLCVSILGNVYRGAIDSGHLGGYLPTDVEDTSSKFKKKLEVSEMWWKNVFVGRNRSITARIIAVDSVTKIIRLSLLSHIMSMEIADDSSFPRVGSVVDNARVVRLDSGVGALLALPGAGGEAMDVDVENAEELHSNPIYSAASKIRCAYVHISKAIDSDGGKTPEASFAKKFALNKIVPKLRILSNTNWVDNVVSCATAESVVASPILTHNDLKPGAIYKAVPVIANLEGGGILVELSSLGIKGLIPASHVFDKATSSDGSYRNKIRMEKFKVGKKVDVRCLVANTSEKKCTVTAKKSLLTSDIDSPIDDYSTIVPGKVATGFISSVTKKGIAITFYNNVFGRISARKLAEEVGVEDPLLDYKVGDVVKVRVEQCNQRSEGSYVLSLSLNISGPSKAIHDSSDIADKPNELVSSMSPGMIVPAKSMKIIEFTHSKDIEGRDDFVPGHVFVSIKAKYVCSDKSAKGSVTCKIPFQHIFDSYEDDMIESSQTLDSLAQKVLKVGKKIAQEGIVLATTNGRGSPIAPIISLKPKLIETGKQSGGEKKLSPKILLPAPKTSLYMGAYVQGYCARVDSRYGAFVRFLGNLTGIVPKLKGGLDISLYETVLCKIVAMDVTSGKAPKILLKRVKSTANESRVENKANSIIDKVKPGDIVGDIKIDSVNFARAAVTLLDTKYQGCRVKARVHVTMADPVSGNQQAMPILCNESSNDSHDRPQDKDKITEFHVFNSWAVGSIVKNARCIALDVRNGTTYIELTNRTANNEHDGLPLFVEDPSNLNGGSSVSTVITAVSKQNKGIWVQISPGCSGFIPGLEVSSNDDVLNNMNKHFKIGGRIKCSVLPNQTKKGKFKQVVRLSALAGEAQTKVVRGTTIVGRVNRNIQGTRAPSLMVEFRGGNIGRCDITELEEPDDWENMPLGRASTPLNEDEKDEAGGSEREKANEGEYHHGLYVKCRVLSNSGSGHCEISLRESRLDGDLDGDASPEEKEITHAYVINTNKKGCFVRLSRFIEGRIMLKELSDSFIPDPASMFPPGRLVVGKVKKVSIVKSKQKSKKNRVLAELDLRESILLEDQDKLTFDDIKDGEKYGGVVTRIESYGLFVRLENSEVSGLVHLSECSDDYVKSVSALYDPGDLVKVLVIKVDKEEKRIGLSMKASHFEDDESDDDSDMSDDDSDDEAVNSNVKFIDDSDDSDDENYASKLANKMKQLEGDSDSEGSDSASSDGESSDDDTSSDEDSSSDDDEAPQPMDTDVGFNWDASEQKPASDDESDSSSDESDSDDDGKRGHKSRKKATAKKQEEKDIAMMEQRLADGTADENPETSADFERLLASDPNSSENWIKFMAYHLSLADIESARSIADRAFDRIEFREEGEKLNVWTALITLENKYGTTKTFNDAIERASQHNNSKKVYLRVCEMLEKDVANSHGDTTVMDRADEMFTKMCKKFKSKKTVWISHFQYLLKNGRHEEAHKLWKRSIKSLPDYKHVETMSKLAQLEYEYGSAERARTIFDAILEKNRKRMDLLFVYVDKEVKHGDIEVARRILEGTLNPPAGKKKINYNDKQMKSLFKKWYRMEDEKGDDESRMRVKMAAKEYVEKSNKK